jgi:membrane protein YqaA with SNARE-associated domain
MLRRLYDWTMEKAAHRHALVWLAAFSFMEASFFPIPPHPLLGLMCLAQPRRAVTFAIVCTIASVLGGLFGYAIGYFLYDTVGTSMLAALGLAESFPQAACYLRQYGAEIILVKGATPIPFKLITITAGFIGMNRWTFVWASVVSRGILFIGVGVLFRLFGAPIKAFIDRYLGLVTAAFIVAVVAGFVIVGMSGGEAKSEACSATATAPV